MANEQAFPITLTPAETFGDLRKLDDESPLPGGVWYETDNAETDGFRCTFTPGALAGATYLTCDMLLAGTQSAVFAVRLAEGEDGREFICHFALLNECQGRVRLPVEALEQNRWMFPREGAWLKVICGGQRVDLAKVDRLTFMVLRKAEHPVRWCMTAMQAVNAEPDRLTKPLLPSGPLLDELGQSTLVDWPDKTRSVEEMTERLQSQCASAGECRWPESFTRFGGWAEMQFEATGFFRTHHDGRRWWLVDPQGHPFWSAGLDCVRNTIEGNAQDIESALTWSPPADEGFAAVRYEREGDTIIDFLRANLIRAFGPEDWNAKWATIAISILRKLGFNTVANWSDWRIAAEVGFPYVRPLEWPAPTGPKVERIFRDMPDVFDPAFNAEAACYAEQLRESADDPALIGYFLMNEPKWGFAAMTPAEGMLYNCDAGHAREALAEFCRQRYANEADLAKVWGDGVTFETIAQSRWTRPVADAARADLEAFSSVMVEKLYATLTDACRAVDPNHLNLGARYYQVPPDWALAGMRCFDVFSANGYRPRIDRKLAEVCQAMNCPALIGEWHFGALDAGLPASGIGRVHTQADRGKAYRIYTEDAAAQPWCVGVHYFTLYDQSAIGRFDGENYNIGFVDICHKPYPALAEAARASHEAIYPIAAGQAAPFDDEPEYLERLFY